jgi:phosphomannomutase
MWLATLPELAARAERWAAADPDDADRAEVRRRVAAGDEAWLREGFAARLEFGTAGMRGPLGPGPGRMNRLAVRRVTAALARWAAGGRGPVVVGWDGRRGSEVFAADAARVLSRAGLPVVRAPALCPTPHVAYAVKVLGARAGIMVTASHNPPQDNGYKVYGPDGAQIVAPADAEISAHLDALPPGDPLAGDDGAGGAPVTVWGPELEEGWTREILALRVHAPAALRIAYTPLHGVGAGPFRRLMARGGYGDLHVVADQEAPDGAFPTVAFPNPEEPGALDRARALATAVQADLLLANDPDADRIAVGIPDGAGGWRVLDGNEVGTLLAEDLLAHGPGGLRLVATSLVSSQLLSRVARHHGARYAETLTGFKWIARAGLAAAAEGYRAVLGYEEALGVSVGEVVRDKDGLSAALLVADLASAWRDRGGLAAALDALALRHGVHRSTQKSWTLPGADGKARMAAILQRLRAEPPRSLAGLAVVAVVDTLAGHRTALPGGERSPIALPPSDVLGFELEGGSRVLVRPSGTEPKLKVYVEVVEAAGGDLAAARVRADGQRGRLVEAMSALVLAP